MQCTGSNVARVFMILLVTFIGQNGVSQPSVPDNKLKALIVTGQGNHSWKESSADFKTILEMTGRFLADITTSPAPDASAGAWQSWQPVFSDYDVVLYKYRGHWPQSLRDSLRDYVAGGGGLVITHSIVGAFDDWPEYEEMIGMGWNAADQGTRIVYDDQSGEYVHLPRFHGAGAGHGKQHEYLVSTRSSDHPVMLGMPLVWMQADDELYHGMRGPAANLEVLATAFSDAREWGSANHEPVVWTVGYGAGRVFVTVLGHRMADDFAYDPATSRVGEIDSGANGAKAVHSVGFQTLLARGAEWAATGGVTIPVPLEFPTSNTPSVVPPNQVSWR